MSASCIIWRRSWRAGVVARGVLSATTERSDPVLTALIMDGDAACVSDSAVHPDVPITLNGAFTTKVARCQMHVESQLSKHMVLSLFPPWPGCP